jgi:Ca2+-binding RTX toxin-like protein
LHGGKGHDQLRGGRGDDVFVFAERPSARHADTIEDFRHNHDTLLLHAFDFRGVGWGGLRNSSFLAADGATEAHDGSDRIVYDSGSGALYYDPDGLGGDNAIHFATLESAPRLDADDFLIA